MKRYSFCSSGLQILCLLLSMTGSVANSKAPTACAIQNVGTIALIPEDGANLKRPALDSPNTWRGITPLRSTRIDVEKLLGKPVSFRGSIHVYETNEEEVAVVYSAGKCVLSSGERWNVPTDVVITIERRPKKPILIQSLQLEQKRYPRVQLSHPENWFVYMNREDGVMFETVLYKKKENIIVISYFPRTIDKDLRCFSPKPKNNK